jgi:hypothetical protein
MENSFHFFPLWKRGMKGDLTAFQKAKLLPKKNIFPGWFGRCLLCVPGELGERNIPGGAGIPPNPCIEES